VVHAHPGGALAGRIRRNASLIRPLVNADSAPSAAPKRSAIAGSPRRAARSAPMAIHNNAWSAALDRP
jgi:hypothetical protein